MPPKMKITKQDIVQTALDLIRRDGTAAINARNSASALGCSTQPVFSNFASMEELQRAVTEAAHQAYFDFLKAEAESGQYPVYKAFGIGYIRFAYEEKELFKMLFMCDRQGEDPVEAEDFEMSVKLIMEANGLSREQAKLMHLEMWVCVHGIATMLATSFFTPEWSLISQMISDIYRGLRLKHLQEETDHGCHQN